MFSFFKKFGKKRKKNIVVNDSAEYNESKQKHLSVELCEQMIETSKELEDIREEYRVVTNYLNDVQLIDDLPQDEKSGIVDSATHIMNLNHIRDELLESRNRMSESQFAYLQNSEDELPRSIKRLESNETYLAAIERDMHTLEGEKLALNIDRKDAVRELRQLRHISILTFVLFGTLIAVFFVLTYIFEKSVALPMLVVMFFVVLIGSYTLIRQQDCHRDIKQCDLNLNHAISLENHVKIRYVNMKNAVDYTCEKYHVNNSKELLYLYEQYQDTVKERRKFREANDDLTYYGDKLIRQLNEYHLYDSRIWLNYAHAICDKKEMVELKHNLLIRRQKLRNQMEYNLKALEEMKEKALVNAVYEGENKAQIEMIIKRVEQMNRGDKYE